MAITILGGALFQWPIGHLSDRRDRRWVLFWVCISAAAVAGIGFVMAEDYEFSLMFIGLIYGGLAFTVYGLNVAYVNDLIDKSRVLEVAGGLLLLYGIGATVGPTLAGAVMDWMGPGSLMLYFAIVLLSLAGAIWYYAHGRVVELAPDQPRSDYVVMGSGTPAAMQMDPRNAPEEATVARN